MAHRRRKPALTARLGGSSYWTLCAQIRYAFGRSTHGKNVRNSPSNQVTSETNHVVASSAVMQWPLDYVKARIDIPPLVNLKFEEDFITPRFEFQVNPENIFGMLSFHSIS